MIGIQEATNLVYLISAEKSIGLDSPHCSSRLVRLHDLKLRDWYRIQAIQGLLSFSYLHIAYAHPRVSLMLIEVDGALASVLWVVPAEAIRRNYPFVKSGSAIISCVTSSAFRGKGLYPYGIGQIARSEHSGEYYIWARTDNAASLRGIVKAGGVLIGEFRLVKMFKLFRNLKYCDR